MLLKPMKLSLSTLNDQFLALITWKGNMQTFFFLNFLFFGRWNEHSHTLLVAGPQNWSAGKRCGCLINTGGCFLPGTLRGG